MTETTGRNGTRPADSANEPAPVGTADPASAASVAGGTTASGVPSPRDLAARAAHSQPHPHPPSAPSRGAQQASTTASSPAAGLAPARARVTGAQALVSALERVGADVEGPVAAGPAVFQIMEPRIVMSQLSSKFSRLPGLAMVLLGLCANAPLASADPLVLKAGIAEPSNSDLAWWMADVGGFFAEQGLKVEFVPGDGNRGLKDLQAGRIYIMHRGLSNIVNVNRSGGDLRLIGCLGDKVRFVFFAAPGVNSSADLKGGVVAISNFGSEGDSAATLALKQLGLTRDDVTIKEVSPSVRAHRKRSARSTSMASRWPTPTPRPWCFRRPALPIGKTASRTSSGAGWDCTRPTLSSLRPLKISAWPPPSSTIQ